MSTETRLLLQREEIKVFQIDSPSLKTALLLKLDLIFQKILLQVVIFAE